MRHRLVLLVTVVVAAVHGWLIGAPGTWSHLQAQDFRPDPPPSLDAIWVHLPAPPPPAAPTPSPAPAQPSPQHLKTPRKAAVKPPPRAPEIAPTPAVATAVPALAQASAPPETESPAEPLDTAPHTHPGGLLADTSTPTLMAAEPNVAPRTVLPSLQVRNGDGSTVPLVLPTDGSALAQTMLLRFTVHGFVKGMEYHANAELAWRAENGHYQARQSISAFLLGSMEQTSTGLLTDQGLQPMQFTDRRFAKHRSVAFNWTAQQATFEPVRDAAPIGRGAQDRLSVFLQLASMLHSMPTLRVAGTRIDIPTLGSRRLQMWRFVVEQEETLSLPGGPTSALRLQRLPQPGDEDAAVLWLAPEQGYVPVQIRLQERNGDVMDLSLKP
jgi:hypothetical protein